MSTPSTMPINRTQTAVATRPPQGEAKDVTVYTPFASTEQVKLSVAIVQRMIAVKTKQGHNCSDVEAIKFIAMCKARGLNPFEGDAFLIGYDTQDGPKFSLITAHQAFLKRAELHPEYRGMESGVVVSPGFQCEACGGQRLIVPQNGSPLTCPICEGAGLIDEIDGDIVPPEQELIGAWAVVHKKDKLPTYKRIPIGPFRKPFGVWKDNPAGMIVKCAEADGLRTAFPNTLAGLYLREEIDLFPDQPSHAAPPPTFLGPIETDGPKPHEHKQPEATTQERAATEQKPAPEPSQPQEASSPTPEAETPDSEPEEAASGPAFVNVDPAVVEQLKGEKLIVTVAETLKLFGIAEGQLTQWARKTPGMCKPDQTWRDLSEGKLRSVLLRWSGVGPVVKAVEV